MRCALCCSTMRTPDVADPPPPTHTHSCAPPRVCAVQFATPSPFPWPSFGPNPFTHCRFSQASLTGLSSLLHPLNDGDALASDRKSGELLLQVEGAEGGEAGAPVRTASRLFSARYVRARLRSH
jgi:hypothetical protein